MSVSCRLLAISRKSGFLGSRPSCSHHDDRWFSSSTPPGTGEKLRVAIVGGGAAGLSTALHLAPLVEKGLIASPIDIYEDSSRKGKDIGVGIWSTALDPFRLNSSDSRQSHAVVYEEMTRQGKWVGDAGYRTPNGDWLMKSHLPVDQEEADKLDRPALLFLREKDMLKSLQKAVILEEQRGMIQVHRQNAKTHVTGLYEQSSQPWSTKLIFDKNAEQTSDRDYHLIIAADGTNSILRRDYGGHESVTRSLTGAAALPSPIDLPNALSQNKASWDEAQRRESVGLQDRNYTVFRGNSPLTNEAMGMGGVSFQTWGVGHSMRFATVPMLYPGLLNNSNKREEGQVWFITIDNEDIASESDPVKRKAMLLEQFKDWHDPICRTVEATPPDEILMERAIAHRHCMGPVFNFNKVVQKIRNVRPPNSGEGPCVVFMGDAYMTVDPILAQGFTVAMEGSYDLRHAVEQACKRCERDSSLDFDPYLLRDVLKRRHEARIDRLICLLRITELVQALGQPEGETIGGAFNTKIFRPLAKLIPNFVKAPIFDSVMKYSLGLGLSPFRSKGKLKYGGY
jgi:2-polyprenyl-6-methoxyphenol hydroxylase-like FAD-dependent oxidoreductase